jgi:hypothetical protein
MNRALMVPAMATLILGILNNALAATFELTPTPTNPPGNTITINDGDTAESNADPYENRGTIIISDGGTLDVFFELVNLKDEDNLGAPNPFLINEEGGTLNINAIEGKVVVDSTGTLNNAGVINIDGELSSDWSFHNQLTGVVNNNLSAAVTNKKGLRNDGEIVNASSFSNINATLEGLAGGYMENVGTFTNLLGSTLTNTGQFENFGLLDNSGSISNDSFPTSGLYRGIFKNRHILNNLAGATAENRERWFNLGTMNNSGTFTNSLAGLGMSNSGVVNNLADGTFENDHILNNSGEFNNDGTLTNTGTLNNTGTLDVGLTGVVDNTGAINNGATVTIDQGGQIHSSTPGMDTYTQTAGTTVVNGSLVATTIDIQAGILSGSGTLIGPVTVGPTATVSPGNSTAKLTIDGTLTFDATSTVEIEINGSMADTQYDVLEITDAVTLAGTLTVTVDAGFTPAEGEAFDVITFASHSGQFDDIIGGMLPDGRALIEVYNLTELRFVASYFGDGNLDGVVDGLDYLLWAGAFGDDPAADPPGAPQNGDYNNDGLVDGLDYLVWAGNFGAGSATAVPEPVSGWMFLLGIVALTTYRHRPRR